MYKLMWTATTDHTPRARLDPAAADTLQTLASCCEKRARAGRRLQHLT